MAAPIYLKIADVAPRPLPPLYQTQVVPETLLRNTWGNERQNRGKIGTLLQTSFDPDQLKTVRPERNGFIGTVITAYGQHHHLIIRPDDVWLAILTQFNFYVNANAEQLRSKFVAHDGKKTLRVNAIDFSSLAIKMSKEIHKNLVDKDFKDWILPNFTTTTDNDTIVCAAAMMATLKSYFTYEGGITCGIPSITLEGTQKDWLTILYRLDKLEEFGVEPTSWAALLRPILSKFVQAFDGEVDVAFWKTIVNRYDICGVTIISGWITAFGVWSEEGNWRGPALRDPDSPDLKQASFATVADWPKFDLSLEDMPVGFFDFELKLIDDEIEYECIVVAGHVASLAEGTEHDTIRPQSGWFVFTKAAISQSIAMQVKLKSQKQPKSGKSKLGITSLKTKSSKYNADELNEELSHRSGCFCIKSSIFSLFRRRLLPCTGLDDVTSKM